MLKTGLVCTLMLVFAAAANAGIVVSLEPINPPAPGDCYDCTLEDYYQFNVVYTNDTDLTLNINTLKVSFMARAQLGDPENRGCWDPWGDPEGEFTFTPQNQMMFDLTYSVFPEYDAPSYANLNSAYMESIAPQGSYNVGILGVNFRCQGGPDCDPPIPGCHECSLDILNAYAEQDATSSYLNWSPPGDPGNTTLWSGFSGDLYYGTGGIPTFCVTPEPASLALLGLGGLALLRRR